MPTPKQLAANRRNAQKSTGPRTSAGQEKVSQNSRTHGLCGAFTVLESENQAQYDDLLERYLQAEQPADDVERELVAKMARHTWMSERAVRLQEACFLVQPLTPEDSANGKQGICVRADIDVYIRYQAAHDRAYQRAANELAKRRKERRQAEIGFASQERKQREEARREAEESRKSERHAIAVATAKLRNQREEIKFGDYLAKVLPPNLDFPSLNPLSSAAAPNTTPPCK